MELNDMVTFEVNGRKCVALVRKLTEREAFRLMGVDEAHIDTIANCGVSRSAQYKMAGNSIVVDVLYHIFRTAFIPSQRDYAGDLFGTSNLIRGEFTKRHPLRVATLCSGYDSQFMALERLHRDFPDFHYRRVWYAEHDPESNKPDALLRRPVVHADEHGEPEERSRQDRLDRGGLRAVRTTAFIVAMRTRSNGEWFASEHFASMEIRGYLTSSITSVQKDNLVMEIYTTTKKEQT